MNQLQRLVFIATKGTVQEAIKNISEMLSNIYQKILFFLRLLIKMSVKNKYKAKYQDEWSHSFEFRDWIQKDTKDPTSAFCRYCQKTFLVAGQGIKQVYSHMNSSKHKKPSPLNVDVSGKYKNEQGQMTVNFSP